MLADPLRIKMTPPAAAKAASPATHPKVAALIAPTPIPARATLDNGTAQHTAQAAPIPSSVPATFISWFMIPLPLLAPSIEAVYILK